MENFIKKYERNKWLTKWAIVMTALVLAFWIHFTLFWSENFSKYLKANVFQIDDADIKADIFIWKNTQKENHISVVSWSNMKQVKSINFSLLFNEQEVEIKDFFSDIDNSDIQILNNNNWVAQIQVIFNTPLDLDKKREIITAKLNKKTNWNFQINLVSTTFKDTNDQKFELSASWLLY